MEFDERLHHTFDTLAERLHQEIAAQLNAVRADLAGGFQADRDATVADAARNARAAAERELAERTISVETEAKADAAAAENASTERLVEAIRAVDAATSLSEVLDVLVTRAGAEVARVGIFLPQGSMLKGWRFVGFDGLDVKGTSVELPFAGGGLIAEAGETGRLIRLDPGSLRETLLPAFVELPDDRRALAVPLTMTERVFAVLYADEGTKAPAARASWPLTIEVLARHAARALEAITASRLAQVAEVAS